MRIDARSFAAFWLTLVLAAPALAAATKGDLERDTQAIIAGERAWGQAFVTGDAPAVERLLADDFIGIDTKGNRYDKASALRDVREGPQLTSDNVTNIVVRVYGNTAVAQADEHEIGPAPENKRYERVFTDTWIKINGQWRIVAAEDLDPTR